MEKRHYKIAEEFSVTPGPRLIVEGPYSGELFRTTIFAKLVRECIDNNLKLVVDLDGASGYGTSFLEETFGGLLRHDGFSLKELINLFEFISIQEPYLIDEIMQYMEDQWEKQKHS